MFFTVKNLMVSLLVPPLGFLTLTVAGLVLMHWWRRFGLVVVWFGVIALFALATPLVSDTILVTLEQDLPMVPPQDNPPQAIIVLGAEITRTLDTDRGVQIGRLTLERLRAAAELQRRTGLPILVTGGSTQPDTPPVGELMALSLQQDFQVPVRWVENRSRDTWENAALSHDILARDGIRSVYVVTHAWHLRRALIAFRPTGLVITAAPTSLDRPIGPVWSDLEPRASALEYGYYALHEWIGCAWYAWR